MASTYSTSSLVGFVSSKRRLQRPLNSRATPKSRQIALAWPICRYPFGSGGNRVCTRPPCRPLRWSSATISRTKSSGAAGADVPASPLRRDRSVRLRRYGETGPCGFAATARQPRRGFAAVARSSRWRGVERLDRSDVFGGGVIGQTHKPDLPQHTWDRIDGLGRRQFLRRLDIQVLHPAGGDENARF